MYYERFEDLPVWKDAIDLAVRLLGLSQGGQLGGVGDLKSQIERACISISNNIAEGFERGTNEELLSFLYIAKGSAAEVRSMLHLLGRMPRMEGLAPHFEELLDRVENVSRQLGRWIESLKDSAYKGKRYQNTQTRQAADAAKRRDQFLVRVREAQDEAIRGRSTTGGEADREAQDQRKPPTGHQERHPPSNPDESR